MTVTSLLLKQFRSYGDYMTELSAGVNVVVGPNGSGKTNLLEALYVVARGKSFRVADAELVQHGKDWARVEAAVGDHHRTLTLKRADHRVEKQWSIDGTQKTRLHEHQRLHVVLFEPRHMQLLTGSPERRREFIDDMLDQLEVGYGKLVAQYRRALAQRNALLRQERVPNDHFFVWNVRLSELGAMIIKKRRQLTQELSQLAEAMYQRISGVNATVTLVYDEQTAKAPDERLASVLLHALDKNHHKDRERGFTSVGPHRDDISLVLNGLPAGSSASRGETRSLVVMLKLLEAQLLQTRHDTLPIVLLDDVFGELDASRRHALATHFTKHQVIITATDVDNLAKNAKIIRL